MKSSVTIWDSDAKPTTSNDNMYTWNGYNESESIFSLQRYIEDHDTELRSRYTEWVYDLSLKKFDDKSLVDTFLLKKDFSYWWMTNFIEQSVLKSPSINDIIKIFSLEKILKELKPENVILVSSNRALISVIQDLCTSLDINFTSPKKQNTIFCLYFISHSKKIIFEILKAVNVLLSYLIICISLRAKRKKKWKCDSNTIFVATYFTNFSDKKAAMGSFYSNYWGKLHDLLKDMAVNVNWLHLYQDNVGISSSNAKNLINNFNSNDASQAHNLLESYCTKNVIFKVIKSWFRINIINHSLNRSQTIFSPVGSNYSLWPLLQNDWNSSLMGSDVISNLFYFELFNNLLKSISFQKVGIYLLENQSWERAFIYLWKRHGHGELIGVAHSFVRFWDLRYFNDSRLLKLPRMSMPKPDLVVLNGPNAMNTFSESNAHVTFIECEALRYDTLSKTNVNIISKSKGPSSHLDILILGEYSLITLEQMLFDIAEVINLIDITVSLYIKPHPATLITSEAYSFLTFKIITEPLAEIMLRFDLIITGSLTVASLDVLLSGQPLIILLDQKKLNLSPLRGKDDVCFVSTVDELRAAIIDSCYKPTSNHVVEDFFNIDVDLPRWRRLVSESLI